MGGHPVHAALLPSRDFIRVPSPAASMSTSSGRCCEWEVQSRVSFPNQFQLRGNGWSRNSLLPAREYYVCQTLGIMSRLFTFIEQWRADDSRCAIQNLFKRFIIDSNLMGAFGSVTLWLFFTDRLVVYNYKIKVDLRSITLHRIQMLPRRVAVRFTRLSHQIADKDLHRAASPIAASNASDQKVWQNTGVERAGPDGDHVSMSNRLQRFRKRQDIVLVPTATTNR